MLRICIIGVGHFGKQHLNEWLKLADQKLVTIKALIVKTEQTKANLEQNYKLPVYTQVDDDFFSDIGLVDIVTPADTHAQWIERCLPFCHVLVEKPIVASAEELTRIEHIAEQSKYSLSVCHNYRFHPVLIKLKELMQQEPQAPSLIDFYMINKGVQPEGLNPNLEFVHAFDIIDSLLNSETVIELSQHVDGLHEISLRYANNTHGIIHVGWKKNSQKRSITITYPHKTFSCDLLRGVIRIQTPTGFNTINFEHQPVSLQNTLNALLQFLTGQTTSNPVCFKSVKKATNLALRTTPKGRNKKPRVAVIGGGIFGTNCALELKDFCDVSLFERNQTIMEEVSLANQWRHHSGFHYPRSYDTIQEIRAAKKDFDVFYSEAVHKNIISYFCPSITGVEIPAERYLAACASNYLSFAIEYPPESVLDRNTISVSLRTDEGVYDYYKLKHIVEERLNESSSIDFHTNSNVTQATILPNGVKKLWVDHNGQTKEYEFDFVINATYSGLNLLATWFDFPIEPLRFDMYELLVLRLPIDPVCVTIIDGPFTSLVSMGYDNLFLLSHIHDSVLQSEITEDGLPPQWSSPVSNRHNMLLSASKYMPILKNAEVVESRFAIRAVNAFARDFDARPTVIRNHGFGCWSVLGGKIITSVTNAREIADAIRQSCQND